MKQFIVSLNLVTSNSIKKKQIVNIFERDNYNLTDRELRSGKGRLWRIESTLDDSEPLFNHLDSIVSAISLKELLNCKSFVENIYFDIGVLSDTYTCTVDFPFKAIKCIADFYPGIELSVTYYPSEED